jgi:RHS repeat-associated protein
VYYTGAISATYGYDYDKVGNMIAYTETITSTTVVTRFFDDANRLEISVQDGITTTYTYDDNGNLTLIDPPGASGTTRYGYDQRNLMITSTLDGSAVAGFAYDGMNNRLRQVDFTGATAITTTYANDILGLSQVLIADDGTNQVVNLFGLDLILQDDGTGALALLADGLGSVRLEMVGDAVQTNTTYSPYGKELALEGDSATVYGFTGEQEDGATGLLYLRARYYSSGLMTFVSRDPWAGDGMRPASLNGWSYAEGNPIQHADPTGKWICTLESYLFNPNCDDWVANALKKLETDGGLPGRNLVKFFERRDRNLTLVSLACLVLPPPPAYLGGIRITIIPDVGGFNALTIPPGNLVIPSDVAHGATPSLNNVATFGHEITHLQQGSKAFSVQGEMLSAMFTYRLEAELMAGHHYEGEFIKDGPPNSLHPLDPWDDADLQAFKERFHNTLWWQPLRPVTGDFPKDWFWQWWGFDDPFAK